MTSFKYIFALVTGLALTLSQIEAAQTKKEKAEYKRLDKIALENDSGRSSGKGSNWHNYTEVYAKYFHQLRNKPIKFLEIGIFEGAGVKMWEKYLKRAELHFIDITFDRVQYFSSRSHYHLANQESASDLLRVVADTGGNFDVIIDDGGHTMQQQLVSFCTLFPHVKSGGMYIIEDLHTSYWSEYGGNGTVEAPLSGPGTFVNFLKDLVDEVNFVGARTRCAGHHKIPASIQQELTLYRKDIYSMHFYDSLCIILKR